MFLKKYNSIMERDEEHRNKWALGLTVALSVFIFTGFAFYNGYLNFNNSPKQIANVVSADLAPTPLKNSKQTFGAAFEEISKQYGLFKESVSAVLVPFITGIEVYDRK